MQNSHESRRIFLNLEGIEGATYMAKLMMLLRYSLETYPSHQYEKDELFDTVDLHKCSLDSL